MTRSDKGVTVRASTESDSRWEADLFSAEGLLN